MSDTTTFTIPYPTNKKEHTSWNKRFGLNAIYTGKHWRKRQEDAEYWRWLTIAALNSCHIPKHLFQNPVKIIFLWDDGLDIDNHAYMGKMIVDALKGVLIKDDTRRYLQGVAHEFHEGKCVEVEIKEC